MIWFELVFILSTVSL